MSNTESTPSDPDRDPAPERGFAGALDRRSLLKGIAVLGAAGAVPFLAACGGATSSSNGNSPTRAGRSSSPTSSSGGGGSSDVLTAVADVPVGGGVILPAKATVVTQPTKGTFEGFSSTCTHMQCTVGTISGGKIICPCHGSMYSIKDGTVVGGPAPRPLPKKPVKVEGSNVVSA